MLEPVRKLEMPDAAPPLYATAAGDVGAAAVASLAVSPFIMVIDKAIIEAAAARQTLSRAVASGTMEYGCRDSNRCCRRITAFEPQRSHLTLGSILHTVSSDALLLPC